jgi:hypothetical protein
MDEMKLYEDKEDQFAITVPAKWTRAEPKKSDDRFRCARSLAATLLRLQMLAC